MTRVFVLAAALAAVCLPASAAEKRVDIAGKSTAETHRLLKDAAWSACREDFKGNALALSFVHECAKRSLTRTIEATGKPDLIAYHTAKPVTGGERALASR